MILQLRVGFSVKVHKIDLIVTNQENEALIRGNDQSVESGFLSFSTFQWSLVRSFVEVLASVLVRSYRAGQALQKKNVDLG
ncbi:hypothetical protein [Endozoicomonas sp. 8E]|uniref:hypothetical protein n=1 Tax=Endozoicomonas sp. 8E TaxID=3035692 RepID=UPI002938DB65|nr:hypothetical protein [Endozoicomonas sp. 8E]WOG26849.1 hypothetical protein P6910_20215 [Endozoicomonas sp. 8E]